MVRNLKPTSALELGSCVSISAAYQATAMKQNGIGKLITLEGSPGTAQVAEETLSSIGLENASVVVGRLPELLSKGVLGISGGGFLHDSVFE